MIFQLVPKISPLDVTTQLRLLITQKEKQESHDDPGLLTCVNFRAK